MLEEMLDHLHNWFLIEGERRCGTFEIVSGELQADFLRPGQYYRIIGSVFNDGLHRYPQDDMDRMVDEAFNGEIWPLAIPAAVIALAKEIGEYCEKHPETDKISESFDGYSYTRGTHADGTAAGGWQAAYRSRMNRWRKVC